MIFKPGAALLSAVFISAAFVSAEDLTLVFRISGPGGDRQATHYYSAKRVRFNQGDEDSVVDFANRRIVNISHRKKQYYETTFAEMEQAMMSMSAEMEKAMAGIPDSLRDKMLGDAAKEVTVTKGEPRIVAALPCDTYTIAMGEKSRMEACVTNALIAPFDPKYFKVLALVTAPIVRGSSGLTKMLEKVRDLRGFSLASMSSLNLLGKKIEVASEATEVRKGPIDPATFAIPEDYKKVDSPFAKMAR